jgi:hypothetical protein
MGLSDDIEAVLQAMGLSDDIEAVLQAMGLSDDLKLSSRLWDFQMILKLSSRLWDFQMILKLSSRLWDFQMIWSCPPGYGTFRWYWSCPPGYGTFRWSEAVLQAMGLSDDLKLSSRLWDFQMILKLALPLTPRTHRLGHVPSLMAYNETGTVLMRGIGCWSGLEGEGFFLGAFDYVSEGPLSECDQWLWSSNAETSTGSMLVVADVW